MPNLACLFITCSLFIFKSQEPSKTIGCIFGSQSMLSGLAAPGNLLEMKIIGSHLRLPELEVPGAQISGFHKLSR